jgi:hypothetical protein
LIEALLSRVSNVRATGQGKWAARCPAHDDKSPSLAIKETPDGTVLLHCFAGCSVHEITSAVGIELSDLFPKTESGKPQRKPWSAADVLRAVQHEALTIGVIAGTMRKGSLSSEDDERLGLAISRVLSAAQVAV